MILNNLNILPFYESLVEQSHNKEYAYGTIYPLITPLNFILPFQIITTDTSITKVEIFDKNNTFVKDITSDMVDSGLSLKVFSGFNTIKYIGGVVMPISMSEGLYYLKITGNSKVWYSELFSMTSSYIDCIKIQYWDNDNLEFPEGEIDYSENFTFNLWACSQIGKPNYEFTEEVLNRDGYVYPVKQISEKTYRFSFLAPEYLIDAMRIIRMSDNIIITSKGQTYILDSFLMSVNWQDDGFLASVDIEFQCDTIVKKIGKGYVPNGGDFNDDFNNDFNI